MSTKNNKTTKKIPPRKNRKSSKKELTLVAQDVILGRFGSGRERHILLRDAGFDPFDVEKEVALLIHKNKK